MNDDLVIQEVTLTAEQYAVLTYEQPPQPIHWAWRDSPEYWLGATYPLNPRHPALLVHHG